MDVGVGLDEPPEFGVVIACIIVIKSDLCIFFLAGVFVVLLKVLIFFKSRLAIGGVGVLLDLFAGGVCDDVCGIEMVGVQEGDALGGTYFGNSESSRKIDVVSTVPFFS